MWRDQLDLARAQQDLGTALRDSSEAARRWLDAYREYHRARMTHFTEAARAAEEARDEAAGERRAAAGHLKDLNEQGQRLQTYMERLRDTDPERFEAERPRANERARELRHQIEQAEQRLDDARTEWRQRRQEFRDARDDAERVRQETEAAREQALRERANLDESGQRADELTSADRARELDGLQDRVDTAERDSGKSREDDLGTYSRQLDHLLGNELLERNRVRLNVPDPGGRTGIDAVLQRFDGHLTDDLRARLASDYAKNPYPFFSDRGHTVRSGSDSATLKLRSANNDWRRSDDVRARPDDSVPDLGNADSTGRETSRADGRSAGARRTVGGGFYINPMMPGTSVTAGPAINPSVAFAFNQPSTSETVGQDTSTRTEASVGGARTDYATDLVAELTVPPNPADGDGQQGAPLQDINQVNVPNGLNMTVELGERTSEAPDRIRIHDPFAPGARPDGAQDIGAHAPAGHTGKVNGVYHAPAQEGAGGPRTTMADWVADHINQERRSPWQWVKDTMLPDFVRSHPNDPSRADRVREQFSDDSVRDLVRDSSHGPVYLDLVDNRGRPRIAKMWSVPTDLTRIPDAPAKLDVKDSTSSAKSTDRKFMRSDVFSPGIGFGAVLQVFGNLFRIELPMFEYKHDRERGLGNSRQSGATTSMATESGDTAMYHVNRNFYLQFDGEDTPHRFTGSTVEALGIDDAQLLADPHRNDTDARERADHVPVYPHLRRDRPEHLGGTTVRGITWEDGNRYASRPAADDTDSASDDDADPPRTVIEAYAQQVLDSIARKYPGLVIPDLGRARSEFAHRPEGEHDDAFFSRENHFRRNHPIAVYNTLKLLNAISEENLSRDADKGIDVHLIETAKINPDLSNFNPQNPDKEGWFLPDMVTIRLTATPRDREFGGTVTKNHTSVSTEGSSGRKRHEEHSRSHTGGVRVRGVYRDIPGGDARAMPGAQGGVGVRGHVTHPARDTFRPQDERGPNLYDGHRVDLMTDGNGQPVRITAQMELEAPAQLDPHAREPEPTRQDTPAEDTTTGLRRTQARDLINGGRPDAPARTPQAAGLDTIPTYTQKISTTVGDVDLRQRLHDLLNKAPGLPRYLKERPAAHDFLPTHYSDEQLAANAEHLMPPAPGHRSRNWMRDIFFSGRHTTALFADRTDATFHDPRPDSSLKISSQHDTSISRTKGSSLSGGVETEVRGAGNPNPSAESLRSTQGPDGLRANQANAPTIQPIWNPLTKTWTSGHSTSESATYSQKRSFDPQGGAIPYTANLDITGAAEVRKDWDFAVNIPRHSSGADYRGQRFTADRAEFGYVPTRSAYQARLVNDRYVPPGDGETAGRTEPQPNPNLDTRRFRVRPGFEDQGTHLGSTPRPQGAGGGSIPTGVQLEARLRRDNHALTGESREAVLAEITAHTTGRGAPKTLDVKLFRIDGPTTNQIRHGTIKVETVRGRPVITDLGGKGKFGEETTLSTPRGTTDSSSRSTGRQFEFSPMVPTPLPRGNEPGDLPSGLPRTRLINVTPAPTVSSSSGTNQTDSVTDKDTVAWTTELTGPYAITETPEHIRLTVSYGGRSYTIEGDHATVQESFEAAYLDVVADPERPAVGPGLAAHRRAGRRRDPAGQGPRRQRGGDPARQRPRPRDHQRGLPQGLPQRRQARQRRRPHRRRPHQVAARGEPAHRPGHRHRRRRRLGDQGLPVGRHQPLDLRHDDRRVRRLRPVPRGGDDGQQPAGRRPHRSHHQHGTGRPGRPQSERGARRHPHRRAHRQRPPGARPRRDIQALLPGVDPGGLGRVGRGPAPLDPRLRPPDLLRRAGQAATAGPAAHRRPHRPAGPRRLRGRRKGHGQGTAGVREAVHRLAGRTRPRPRHDRPPRGRRVGLQHPALG
ncbi:hypothetical protein [Marinitenerispora sediminis]|uniref:hypothetical protein n=1 Tax=Marinitenerispora sediminis TaxID=1931232 RepID=UPI0015F1BB58|nr:hypothetical protein [Marinitenerispora sediminis]